jgi:hypothetical protein
MSTAQAPATNARRGKSQAAAASTTAAPAAPEVVPQPATSVATSVVDVSVTAAKPVAKRAAKATVATPETVTEAAPTTAPVVEGQEAPEPSLGCKYDNLQKEISELDKKIADNIRNRANLTKESAKLFHQLSRSLKKRSKDSSKSSKRATSGFNKAKLVPAAFRRYLGLDDATELPRTDVTKKLYAAIKERKLLDEADKRKIKVDPTLRTLFCMKPEENLEFNNFQSFVSRVYENDPETQALKLAAVAAANATA